MKKFIRNIVFFIFPVIIIVAGLIIPFYSIAQNTGEFKQVDEWISIQENSPDTLVGLRYNEQTAL